MEATVAPVQPQQLQHWGVPPRLGQDGKPPIEDTLPAPTQLDIAKLQAQAAREQIATQRHARVTGTIQAIAIGGTFLLTLFALRRNI